LSPLRAWLPDFIRREPLGAISFVVSTLIGVLSSPFLVDWYTGAKVLAEIHTYRGQDTGACGDWRMVIQNIGRKTAKNVRIQFDVDSFTARGDLLGYYSGDEPFARVTKNVEYKTDLRLVLIPELPPSVRQEFVYAEESRDSETDAIRGAQSASRTREVDRLPRISLVTTDDGIAKVTRAAVSAPCQP
jgi:hypothetical protein